jgi:hypothetical protein
MYLRWSDAAYGGESFRLVTEPFLLHNLASDRLSMQTRKAVVRCRTKIIRFSQSPPEHKVHLLTYCFQGDQKSLWKIRPKCSPTHFLSKLKRKLNSLIKWPKKSATLANGKQSPIGQIWSPCLLVSPV